MFIEIMGHTILLDKIQSVSPVREEILQGFGFQVGDSHAFDIRLFGNKVTIFGTEQVVETERARLIALWTKSFDGKFS